MTGTRKAKRAKRTDFRSEKQVEHSGDLLMGALGFMPIRFSQARATMQTPGIPDRLYLSPARRTAVWFECKTVIGVQSAFQKAFQASVEACGQEYVVGTDEALTDWAVAKGYAVRAGPHGLRVVPP